LAALFPSLLGAHVDGITLDATVGATPDEVSLDWSGGQPTFQIYRSSVASDVIAAGNLIGESEDRQWADVPGPGTIFFYEITSPCQYNPPEICNGIDDDCNGTVDDNVTDPWAGQACCPTGNLADCQNSGTGTRCQTGIDQCTGGRGGEVGGDLRHHRRRLQRDRG
jgi:hypothetical protein